MKIKIPLFFLVNLFCYTMFSMEMEIEQPEIQQEIEQEVKEPTEAPDIRPIVKEIELFDENTQKNVIESSVVDYLNLENRETFNGQTFKSLLLDRSQESLPLLIGRTKTAGKMTEIVNYFELYLLLNHVYKPVLQNVQVGTLLDIFQIIKQGELRNRFNWPLDRFGKDPLNKAIITDPIEIYFVWSHQPTIEFIGTDMQLFSNDQEYKIFLQNFLKANAPNIYMQEDQYKIYRAWQTPAQYYIASWFEKRQQYSLAFRYYDLVAESNISEISSQSAKLALARMYLLGLGTAEGKKFPKKAKEYFEELLQSTIPEITEWANYWLAVMFVDEQKYDQASEILTKLMTTNQPALKEAVEKLLNDTKNKMAS